MYENDQTDAGRTHRDAAHETNGSAETVARELPPPKSVDAFRTTVQDGFPPRVPNGLPSTFEDGSLRDRTVTPPHDPMRNPEPEAWEDRLPRVPGYEVLP